MSTSWRRCSFRSRLSPGHDPELPPAPEARYALETSTNEACLPYALTAGPRAGLERAGHEAAYRAAALPVPSARECPGAPQIRTYVLTGTTTHKTPQIAPDIHGDNIDNITRLLQGRRRSAAAPHPPSTPRSSVKGPKIAPPGPVYAASEETAAQRDAENQIIWNKIHIMLINKKPNRSSYLT